MIELRKSNHSTSGKGPVEIRQLLESVLTRYKPAATKNVSDRVGKLAEFWESVVGPDFAAWTSVVSYRHGVLTVIVDSAPLAAELDSFAKTEIVAGLREMGLEELSEIRFRVK